MKFKKSALWIVVIAFLVSGCISNSTPPRSMSQSPKPNSSIVYGYIEMEEAPVALNQVFMQLYTGTKYGREQRGTWFRVENDIFYKENVLPGTYIITGFGGANLKAEYWYELPYKGRGAYIVKVGKTPSVYFAGALKYKPVKKVHFSKGKFRVQRIKVKKVKLLEQIRQYAKHPHWIKLIDKKIRRLK